MKPKKCERCGWWSESHWSCFHPESWTQGEFFKVPGNPLVLNPDGKCKRFDKHGPVRKRGWIKRLLGV